MSEDPPGIAVKLDVDGDIVLETDSYGNIDFQLVEGSDEVAQALTIRLRTFLGEDRVEPTMGIPWDRVIAVFTPELVSSLVTNSILKDPRVKTVGEITSTNDPVDRVLTMEVPVTLKDGSTITLVEAFGV